MTMDLIAAEHLKKMDGTQAIFSLGEDKHTMLLAWATPAKFFPVLHKIEDYYKDSIFLFGELNSLQNELNEILKKHTESKQVISEFLLFVKKAITARHNLYITAD